MHGKQTLKIPLTPFSRGNFLIEKHESISPLKRGLGGF